MPTAFKRIVILTLFLLPVIAISLVCIRSIWVWANPKFEKNQTLVQARSQWNSHHISSYRMVISYKYKQYGGAAGTCDEEVEVHNNIIVTNASKRPCYLRSFAQQPTVMSLFDRIESNINFIRWDQCDVLMESAIYDSQLGYPRYITYKWEQADINNLGIEFLSTAGQCTILDMFPPDIDDIEIISLTPLDK